MKIKPATVIKTAISVCFLIIVFRYINVRQAWAQLQYLSPQFIVFALLFYTGCQWLSCLRWNIVLQASGYSVPMLKLMSSYFAGMFLNIFLPGSVGGDVYRIYRVAQETKNSEAAIVSVLLERFTGLAALSALAIVGLPPAFNLIGRSDIILLFLACVVSLVVAVLAISSPTLLKKLEPWLMRLRLSSIAARFAKIQQLLRSFTQHRKELFLSMMLSFVLQLAIVYYHYIIAQQLRISISYLELLVFIPIIVVVTLLPISIGGLGLKEGLWIYLFNRVGLSAEQALLLSITITVLGWLLSLPGAIVLLADSAGLQKLKREQFNK